MNRNDISFAVAVASIWAASALAIIAGLYFTKDMRCLWFLLIPACVGVRTGKKEESNNELV